MIKDLRMYKYNYNVDNKDVTFVGYFLVEEFKEDRFLYSSYELTQIFDPITYLNSGDKSNSKVFTLRNVSGDKMYYGNIITLPLED